ncbi:MAG: hypothetical protein U9N34_03550 [Candidatus Cloacimonadota bacterium]|nr:hypothetical protein [Candidatus Cloacimonadota bacterium]
MKKYLLIIFVFVFACSSINFVRRKKLVDVTFIEKFKTQSKIDKCIYDKFSKNYYLKHDNKIAIYSDKKLINQIGGTGFKRSNFNKLSDICFSPENNLITLDSFSQQIKKFDKSGSYLRSFSLNNASEPILITIDDQNITFIFDAQTNEILVYKDINKKPSNRFGKFSIIKPTSIDIVFDKLIVSSKERTLVFSKIGYLLNEFDEKIVFDNYENKLFLNNYKLQSLDDNLNLFLSNIPFHSDIKICDLNLLFYNEKEVARYGIIYE